jgi:hypothetical protein
LLRDQQANAQRVAAAGSRVSAEQAAELLNVSSASVLKAAIILEKGTPELVAAVRSGEAAVSSAAEVAMLPLSQQRDILASKGVDAVVVIGRQASHSRLSERRIKRAADASSGVAIFDHIKIGDGRSIGNVRLGECMSLASELHYLADVLELAANHVSNSDDKRIRDVISDRMLSEYYRRARGDLSESEPKEVRDELPARQAAFARAIADGLEPLAACQRAGYPQPNRMTVWRLQRNDRVQAEIERLKALGEPCTNNAINRIAR